MEKILETYNKYRDYILFFILFIILCLGCGFLFWYFSNDLMDIKKQLREKPKEEKTEEVVINKFIVDIKGEVKKPGVYTLEEGKRIIDVVKKAGGFTVYADASANNLSMKIKDEMVIVIYSESQINNYLETKEKEKQVNEMCTSDKLVNDSCIVSNDSSESNENNPKENVTSSSSENSKDSSDNEETNVLISINKASLDELMKLPGVGESKAQAIIEYREKTPFETIEDIKNVSGIGDSLFEKIKDHITT